MSTKPKSIDYEQFLDENPGLALEEGGMHFEGGSAVHNALDRICRRLDELQVSYAVVGGMALFLHGYRRFTEDVDILVTAEGLRRIHDELEGRGYRPLFEGSRALRDTDGGVRVEFLVAGEYPGDGKPQPISFPDPDQVAVEFEGIRCLSLEALVQLKLASGSTPGRRKDLGDVQELIRQLELPKAFADKLESSVQDLYEELWLEIHS